MAAGMLAKPGTNAGPCIEECEHVDCAETRRMAVRACIHCGKEIGYDRRFYVDAHIAGATVEGSITHAYCEEKAYEDARRKMAKGA